VILAVGITIASLKKRPIRERIAGIEQTVDAAVAEAQRQSLAGQFDAAPKSLDMAVLQVNGAGLAYRLDKHKQRLADTTKAVDNIPYDCSELHMAAQRRYTDTCSGVV
jgi:hypothetical protein